MDPSTCARIQTLLVDGERTDEVDAHLDACDECRFFARLSRDLRSTSDVRGAEALEALLERRLVSGEPLLGRYRLEARIGAGGQGWVYQATDLETEDEVAVKLVRLRPGVDDTALEVAHARRVRHPGVCRVFHTERHGELRLIVMELIDGPTLTDAVASIDRRRALDLFRRIAEAVQAAHEVGVLHLDLKPQNVLLRDGDAPVVTDFGLSARAAGVRRAPGGTPAYMAPEQRRGEVVDERTDVYGLGRLLRDLLHGAPGPWREVIGRACAESPDARHPSVAALLADVGRIAGRRRRVARAVLVVVAVVAFGPATLAVLPRPAGRRAAWRPELWGEDPVPRSAWNVALNRSGRGVPRITASHPAFACAQSLADLIDGRTHYHEWQRGFAFPPPYGVCVALEALGTCGPRLPEARLCERGRRDGPLETRVGDVARLGRPESELGQWQEAVPCGERWLEVELDRPREVSAVRAWHREPEHVPRRFWILVEREGAWVEVSRIIDNDLAIQESWHGDDLPRSSAPVTSEFAPVVSRRVRYVMDTCSAGGGDRPPGHGWLFELEILGDLPKWEAWLRTLREW